MRAGRDLGSLSLVEAFLDAPENQGGLVTDAGGSVLGHA